jgi:hypothetical protein
MLVTIEISRPLQITPGVYRTRVGQRRARYVRVWWLWFALTYIAWNAADHHEWARTEAGPWMEVRNGKLYPYRPHA